MENYAVNPHYPKKKEISSSRQSPAITYAAGRFAIHVAVREVGFIKKSLDTWSRDFGRALPEGTLVPEVSRMHTNEASTGAFIFETDLMKAALRHQFDLSGPVERTRASQLLAQLIMAEDARQEYVDTAETHHDMQSLLAQETVLLHMPAEK